MSSELVYDADAALTAQLLGGMRAEARIGLVAPLFYEHVDISGPTLTAKTSKHPTTSDAGTLTDGTALSNVGINPTAVTAAATSGIGLKSVITKFAMDGSLLSYAEAIANFTRASVNKMDVDGCSILDNMDGACGTSAADLSIGAILNGILDLNEAAEMGNRVMVLDPLQVYDLQSELVASSAPIWTNEGLYAGFLDANQSSAYAGSLFGIPIYQTPNVVDDSTNKIGGLFVANRALQWAWKWKPTVQSVPAPEYGADARTIAVSAAYGFVEVFGAAGVAVTSGNT